MVSAGERLPCGGPLATVLCRVLRNASHLQLSERLLSSTNSTIYYDRINNNFISVHTSFYPRNVSRVRSPVVPFLYTVPRLQVGPLVSAYPKRTFAPATLINSLTSGKTFAPLCRGHKTFAPRAAASPLIFREGACHHTHAGKPTRGLRTVK